VDFLSGLWIAQDGDDFRVFEDGGFRPGKLLPKQLAAGELFRMVDSPDYSGYSPSICSGEVD
jgi:hypothetical protein